MAPSFKWSLILPVVAVMFLCTATPAAAFGAGNIPSYAYLEGKAFRHGDIEDVIEELSRSGGAAAGVLGALTGGLLAKKFKGLDIKRIYFGNWLRDYSQAMDVAGLSKLSAQAIINLVMVLGFMAHGYATGEFEVTEERLGCYLPTEHIDNPKDYNDNKDARQVYGKLRPPVDPAELEIDPRTGMLNYIANENGHWDTSKALIRRTLLQCIDIGRRARGGAGSDAQYEAFRLLGSALHTLEDFTAHSNYCELALLRLGYKQVFCHVGSNVHVRATDGSMVPPLVTGTFGGSDFIHSLLGEATDHISSASVSDLNKEIDKAKNKPADRSIDGIRDMLFQLPGGTGSNLSRDMDEIDNIRAGPGAQDPMNMSPQELHAVLWKILKFRDDVSKAITNTIENIPGLGSLIDKIGDSVSTFVFVTIEPYIKPILQQATGVLQQGSASVVNSQDQFRVFNDPSFYHPTHSILAKDHFNMILNEPAGQIAKLVVRHVVQGVVKAWDDTSINAQQMVEQFLDVLHHPAFQNGSPIQREMFDYMRTWIDSEDKNYTLNALTKDAVRAHKNHRKGHATEEPSHGPGGYTSFLPTPASLQNQATNYVHQQAQHIPGYSQYNQMFPSGPRRDIDGGSQGYAGGTGSPVQAAYSSHTEPPHQYQQQHSSFPGQGHAQYPGQHSQYGSGSGVPGHHGPPQGYGHPPPPPGGFGGPPPGQFGGPPPPGGFGGPPPHQGWNAHPPHGSDSGSGYPGANYQQQHHQAPNQQDHQQYGQPHYQGQQYQQGQGGSGWSAGQAPPSGRW